MQLLDKTYRFGIGPMSKNVVDACLTYTARTGHRLILIPSRRQVEHDGGYSNGWTTQSFTQYVRARDKGGLILLQRDHGGPAQGKISDDGLLSLSDDCQYLDLIHIDPWVSVKTQGESFDEGCSLTLFLIRNCYAINPSIQYEIGTEESIYPFSVMQLDTLIKYLKTHLTVAQFAQIRYAVVQCGTSLYANINTGSFDSGRLMGMLKVCRQHGLLSKEHNGDYITSSLLAYKQAVGLDCVNLAPELGQIETQTIVDSMKGNAALIDAFYRVCLDSRRWVKWFTPGEKPSQEALLNVCGHYVLSDPVYLTKVRPHLMVDIDTVVCDNVIARLGQLHGYTT